LWAQTLRAIDANPAWLSDDAQVIVQIHPREFKELPLEHLTLVDERKYGSTLLCFYELV
jgi:16S rRNA G966 N2-methylase RsmD